MPSPGPSEEEHQPASRGEHPKVVQSLLGNSSITQTTDTYAQLMDGMGGNVVGALDEGLFSLRLRVVSAYCALTGGSSGIRRGTVYRDRKPSTSSGGSGFEK